jgi:hypothetical protein
MHRFYHTLNPADWSLIQAFLMVAEEGFFVWRRPGKPEMSQPTLVAR